MKHTPSTGFFGQCQFFAYDHTGSGRDIEGGRMDCSVAAALLVDRVACLCVAAWAFQRSERWP